MAGKIEKIRVINYKIRYADPGKQRPPPQIGRKTLLYGRGEISQPPAVPAENGKFETWGQTASCCC